MSRNCPSCNESWTNHMGIVATCMRLQEAIVVVADLQERYECKADALNAALLAIDACQKEVDRLREALEKIADYHGDEPWRNNSGIAREALSRQALSGKGE